MSLTEFRQLVENNIPYDSYVFVVGKIKYFDMDSENPPILIPDDPPIPYRKKNENSNAFIDPWFWAGTAWGGFSLYKSFIAFDMYNLWYWTSAKGIRTSTQMLGINPATGKLFQGMSGFLNGYMSAATRAKPLLKVATKISYVGLIIPIASTVIKGEVNVEDSTDFVFAAMTFIPTVGWIISGVYLVVDTASVVTTGEKISTRAKRFDTELAIKWIELEQGLKNWINSMYGGYYGIPY